MNDSQIIKTTQLHNSKICSYLRVVVESHAWSVKRALLEEKDEAAPTHLHTVKPLSEHVSWNQILLSVLQAFVPSLFSSGETHLLPP